jgi:hypothetical protein
MPKYSADNLLKPAAHRFILAENFYSPIERIMLWHRIPIAAHSGQLSIS